MHLVALACLCLAATPFTIYSQNCATDVGSVASSRGSCYTLNGGCVTYTESKLENTANFGPGGTVDHPIVVSHEAGTLDLATLSAYDIFFIGYYFGNRFFN